MNTLSRLLIDIEKKAWECVEINGFKVDYSPMIKYEEEILQIAEAILKEGKDILIERVSTIIIALSLNNETFREKAISIYEKYPLVVEDNLDSLLSIKNQN